VYLDHQRSFYSAGSMESFVFINEELLACLQMLEGKGKESFWFPKRVSPAASIVQGILETGKELQQRR
jgi:hypothetical protein